MHHAGAPVGENRVACWLGLSVVMLYISVCVRDLCWCPHILVYVHYVDIVFDGGVWLQG